MSEDVQTAEATTESPADVTPAAEPAPAPATETPPAPAPAPEPVLLADDQPAAPAKPAAPASEPVKEPAPEPLLADDDEPEDKKPEDPDAHWAIGLVAPEQEEYFQRFKTPGDLARSYTELRKSQSQMVKMPDELASDEEMNAFFNKMGRPKEAKDYKLDREFVEGLDEGGQERILDFLEKMHASGARNEPVKAAVEWYQQEVAAAEAAEDARVNAAHEARLEALKQKWPGNAYTTNVRKATDFLNAFATPDDAKALAGIELADGTKLGKHPSFVEFCFNGGVGMSDASSPLAVSGASFENFTEEDIRQMQSDAHDAGIMTPKGQKLRKDAENARRLMLERKGENHVIGPGQMQHGVRG